MDAMAVFRLPLLMTLLLASVIQDDLQSHLFAYIHFLLGSIRGRSILAFSKSQIDRLKACTRKDDYLIRFTGIYRVLA